ncbi:histidinol-phosphate transaminase [Alicyclobacillus sp.]|uniref:histidinol-phosphate transaminase n=1 Tax=Alicyclobacillus sp. TaxID=61169 RepID=UPI0025BF6BE1|nr:histidinol-phosphate transaminase [Alicyclobacillus sp.]MCL6516573.1 histidinol-phosphate transaminase [Alicyclobacillus sp.]
MVNVASRVRPGIDRIDPYQPGLTDDELKHRFGLTRVIKLNANENALGPSPLALEAIRRELETLHHYPDGSSELLREAIAAFHGVSKDMVLVGNGSDDLIKLVSETFLDPGDEVVVPKPSFSQYGFGAAIMRATVVPAPLRPDFSYDVEAVLERVGPRTKLVYLCTPNNPTGTILTRRELDWLLERLPQDVLVVLDLAYNDYSEHPERVVEDERLLADGRIIALHTFSKLYGLAGLRVGYGLAHSDVWSFVNRVREPFNVNRVAQRAAVAALADEEHRRRSRAHAAASRAFYARALADLGVSAPPTEANFVLAKTGDAKGTVAALMARGVMVRAGFGLPEHVRITFGTEEENAACIEAIAAFLGRR